MCEDGDGIGKTNVKWWIKMVEWQLYAELRRELLAETWVDIALPSKTECICRSLLLKEVGIKETLKTSRTSRTFHANMSEGAVLFSARAKFRAPGASRAAGNGS